MEVGFGGMKVSVLKASKILCSFSGFLFCVGYWQWFIDFCVIILIAVLCVMKKRTEVDLAKKKIFK